MKYLKFKNLFAILAIVAFALTACKKERPANPTDDSGQTANDITIIDSASMEDVGGATSGTNLVAGTYIVTVIDGNTCSATKSVQVVSQGVGTVKANFDMSFQPTCRDGVFGTFYNQSSDATKYAWFFGDGTASNLTHTEHGFTYGKSYIVTLIAYNGACADTLSVPVNIKAFSNYVNPLIPNVFTPNGDTKNDCFEVSLGNGLDNCVEITVFDRWGLKMYENSNGVCWDGRTTSGKAVPDGTYFYIIRIGESEMRGTVSVIR